MKRVYSIRTHGNPTLALRSLFASWLEQKVVQALLVPVRQAPSAVVMQTLVSDPEELDYADPLAPVAFSNAAALLSSITHHSAGARLGAVVRSCDIRAFVERIKLHQGSRDNLLLVGFDCLGRFENQEYLKLCNKYDDLTTEFYRAATPGIDGIEITRACRACVFPVAPHADINICLFGTNLWEEIRLEAATAAGVSALEALSLPLVGESPERGAVIESMVSERKAYRDALLSEYRARAGSVPGFVRLTAACVNCYNCRVACPVCHCRECVFCTDLFLHDGTRLLGRAKRHGALRMPTDTLLYHLTRMVHVGALCVGCGQCSSACPNGVDVVGMFLSAGAATQGRFDYVPGRSLEEKQPMTVFCEDELADVTG